MANDDILGEIDPEIASLLGINPANSQDSPSYEDLLDADDLEEVTEEEEGKRSPMGETFFLPEKYVQDINPIFSNAHYYKSVLSNEGEISHTIHNALSLYLKAADPKEKQKFRAKVISLFWDLYTQISGKPGQWETEPKRFLLRYAMLLPNIISAEQRKILGSIINQNETGEPIHYIDEWLLKVSHGEVSPLATDETAPSRRTEDQKVRTQLDKARGSREAHLTTLQTLQRKRAQKEVLLKGCMDEIAKHTQNTIFTELESLYTEIQSRNLMDIMNLTRELSQIHKEMGAHYKQLNNADQDFRKFQESAMRTGSITQVDRSVVQKEASSIRQMAKLCVGRQGNHLPILMKQFFSNRIENIATRENVIKELCLIERADPGLFKRTFKQKTNRIVPHIILVPCYGDTGICWEPFERYNKATSRGRIAIPLYPKDLKTAVLFAVADLRWQVAKEKAQHYWMEEGLTGHYYQYFSDRKMRGDVRLKFIEDYILWITKESEGIQKLDKNARGILWRDIPFPQDIKDTLRNRGFVYNELYKKDINRASSDGY